MWFFEKGVQLKVHSLITKALTPHLYSNGMEVDFCTYLCALRRAVEDLSKSIEEVK